MTVLKYKKQITFAPNSAVSSEDIQAIAGGDALVRISTESIDKSNHSFLVLQKKVSEKALIYGVTTGYGPLANHLCCF